MPVAELFVVSHWEGEGNWEDGRTRRLREGP